MSEDSRCCMMSQILNCYMACRHAFSRFTWGTQGCMWLGTPRKSDHSTLRHSLYNARILKAISWHSNPRPDDKKHDAVCTFISNKFNMQNVFGSVIGSKECSSLSSESWRSFSIGVWICTGKMLLSYVHFRRICRIFVLKFF